MTTPFDYDADPERFRLASRITREHLISRSLYQRLAELLDGRLTLDIGCGEGALRAALPQGTRLVGLDASATMLAAHPPPVVRADATALPFAAGTFDAAVAVNVLDHLPDPAVAIGEAYRVRVERWDAPLVRLPDRDAVRDYLIARFVAPADAATAARRVPTPLTLTKRGALIVAVR
jgi:SAM-dependent methyltransferase